MMKPKIQLLIWIGAIAAFVLGGCVTSAVIEVGEEANAAVDANLPSKQVGAATLPPVQPGWKVVYENDWSAEAVGEEPADLFILDGAFAVTEMGCDKALALPGVPVGDFGFLFGPRVKGKPVELRCRIFSIRQGRRMPTFAAGLGGMNGYRIRLNSAARNMQLFRGEESVATTPFQWQSGSWTNLRFRAEPQDEKTTTVSAKVWAQDGKEPAKWNLVHQDTAFFAGGKCSLWGLPYADTNILFDDLQVLSSSPDKP